MADFFQKLTFSVKTAFLQISADFVTGFESSSDKDANRCKKLLCSSSGSGDIGKKHKFQNQLDLFFLLLTVGLKVKN